MTNGFIQVASAVSTVYQKGLPVIASVRTSHAAPVHLRLRLADCASWRRLRNSRLLEFSGTLDDVPALVLGMKYKSVADS